MNKTSVIILISIVLTVTIPTVIAYDNNIKTNFNEIKITSENNILTVKESLTIQGTSNDTYSDIKFWIMDNAQNINFIFSGSKISPIPTGNNEYICNISSFNISKSSSIKLIISYTLDKDTDEFDKLILRNTTELSVEFDDNVIYKGEKLISGIYFNLRLYKPTEAPISGYIIVFIILLIIFLIVSTLYAYRKQKSLRIRDISSESEEFLNAKKIILMSILKDIEKQHRSKQISDDTYHKLKGQYKQQAVEIMRMLENIEKEIKQS
jgi:hypothetical protein